MRRRVACVVLCTSLAAVWPRAQSDSIEALFDRLTRELMLLNPNTAIASAYFAEGEQPGLDGRLTPNIDAQRERVLDLNRRGLTELARFQPASLTPAQRVSAEVLRWQLQNSLDADAFREFSFPFDQNGGVNVNLVNMLTVTHPMRTVRHATSYLDRLGQVGARVDESMVQARQRSDKGLIPPRFILTATIAQMKQFVSGPASENPFVTAYAAKLDQIAELSPAQRAEMKATATRIVEQQIVPAWLRVASYLESLVPRSTDAAGLSRLPGGREAYAYRLRNFTTTDLTADEIHALGLKQVAVLEAEMDVILKGMGRATGTVPSRIAQLKKEQAYPLTEEGRAAIMADAEQILRDAERRAALLFDHRPKAPVVVQAYPRFREANAAASYSGPPPNGSRPGVIQLPLRPERMTKFALRTLMYHEGVPGHHFQIALNVENPAMPRFRQIGAFGGSAALSEGWGLYAERLAAEEGWYEDDPIGRLGQLDAELFRARRLVVDTGLHTRNWTREQAIGYGIEVSEVERYVANPGQACAYMIGQLKLLELRDRARTALGSRFSFKDYHNAVLAVGNVPLTILDREVSAYIQVAQR